MSLEEIAVSALADMDGQVTPNTSYAHARATTTSTTTVHTQPTTLQSMPSMATTTATAMQVATKPGSTQQTAAAPKATTTTTRKRKGPKRRITYPVEPRVIQTIPRRKECINHSYRDFSMVPPTDDFKATNDREDIAALSFAAKVHLILSMPEYADTIAWMPHGRSFTVKLATQFERLVCPLFFGHKRYSSFLRQLNNHGFKLTTKGDGRNCYYNECFLRGLPHLCQYMPDSKDARRQIPDPNNEPDFHAISRLFPVPLVNAAQNTPNHGAPTTTDPAPPVNAAAVVRTIDSGPVSSSSNSNRPLQPLVVHRGEDPPTPADTLPNIAIAAAASAPTSKGKSIMDRSAALQEIDRLRACLGTLSRPAAKHTTTSSSLQTDPPPAKRQAILGTGTLGQTSVNQLARMPQFFPTRDQGSQAEAIFQRNAIVNAVRRHQEQESLKRRGDDQQQQQQQQQIQHKLQELRAQKKLEELRAQQQLQEIEAQQTLQKLQAQQTLLDLQQQVAVRELENAKASISQSPSPHIPNKSLVSSQKSQLSLPKLLSGTSGPFPPTSQHYPSEQQINDLRARLTLGLHGNNSAATTTTTANAAATSNGGGAPSLGGAAVMSQLGMEDFLRLQDSTRFR